MKNLYYKLHKTANVHAPKIYQIVYKRKNIIKYIFSGGMATATNLTVLYLLTEYAHVYYLVSSVIAFTSSIVVSFSMQKFWTFNDSSVENIHAQFTFYILVVLANLAMNTFLVHTLVERLHLWYLFAQFIAGAFVAVASFFIYRNFVFKK